MWSDLLPDAILEEAYEELVFRKIEEVVTNFCKLDAIQKNDVEEWLLGWLNFFPEAKVDQGFLLRKIANILEKFELKFDKH